MSIWYTEKHTPHAGITMEVSRTIFSARSEFQQVDVLETPGFGKVLLLDGLVMLTERDEFIYHEMLAHVPLVTSPSPRRVLVIGGGDGGTVREVLKHPDVESVTLVEIDRLVVETSREHFPSVSGDLSDPRVRILYQDGVRYVKDSAPRSFDVILVDSTDPVGPAEALFSPEFFHACRRALDEDGVFASQTESPFYHLPFMAQVKKRIHGLFSQTRFYLAPVMTYPGGYWSFILGTVGDREPPRTRAASGLNTRYYNSDVHHACFALPAFVVEGLDT